MRTTIATHQGGALRSGAFEPLDLPRLAELFEHALEAFDDDRPEEANACLSEAEALGGGFALAWALATRAVHGGVLNLEPEADEEIPPEVVAGVTLASGVLDVASALRLACTAPVREVGLGTLGAVVACLRAESVESPLGHGA